MISSRLRYVVGAALLWGAGCGATTNDVASETDDIRSQGCTKFEGKLEDLVGSFTYAGPGARRSGELLELTLRDMAKLSKRGTTYAQGQYAASTGDAEGATTGNFVTDDRYDSRLGLLVQLKLQGGGGTWEIVGAVRDQAGQITRLCIQEPPEKYRKGRPYALSRNAAR